MTSPSETIMGAETEYGLSADGCTTYDATDHVYREASVVAKHHLAGIGGKVVLRNGGMLYQDCGHVEYCTPECATPHDLVSQQLAGDGIVMDLAGCLLNPVLFKGCVSYGNRATFGAHESYGCFGNPVLDMNLLKKQMLPFLASRPLICGGGGFDARSKGIRFTMSPKAAFVDRAVGLDTCHDRALFNTRNEPLDERPDYYRIHVICGENSCSETGSLLRFGSTALVVKAVEAGVLPLGKKTRFSNEAALKALDEYCTSHDLNGTAGMGKGAVSAVGVQRMYLEAVRCIPRSHMPPWAKDVISLWESVLGRFEKGGPDALSGVLDWPTKRVLYGQRIRKNGFEWGDMDKFNRIVKSIDLEDDSTPVVDDLEGKLRGIGQTMHSLAKFNKLRSELMEIDTRYSQVGPDGIHERLRLSGAVDGRVEGLKSAADAAENPPKGTLAEIRGAAVVAYGGSGTRENYWVDWAYIANQSERKVSFRALVDGGWKSGDPILKGRPRP